MMDADAAWRTLAARVTAPIADEEIAVEDAAGRITAVGLFAAQSSPAYHGAAMDGYAVRAADTLGASEHHPLIVNGAIEIDTGDALPEGKNAVIKIEDVQVRGGLDERAPRGTMRGAQSESASIEITAAVAPWQHVRLTGEDVVAGELVVPQGKQLGPYDLGALLAAGVTRARVRRRPRVAVIATGDELVEPGATPAPGQIVEFNTRVLSALCKEWGADPVRRPPVRDDRAALEAAVRAAFADGADVVCLNAGSSAGRDDHTAAVIGALGELLVHGINVMPGKPTAIGVTPDGRALLGLPGYPVSCAVAAERILKPLLALLLGVAPNDRERVRAKVARKVPSKIGHEEVLRVQVGRVGDGWIAAPLARGAGVITSLSRANALLSIPPLVEGLDAGQEVDCELLVPRAVAERTIVHVGSHDLALDLAGDLLRRRHPGRALASANVGSLGGLYALSRGECHVAGTHLLDPRTRTYNVEDVRRVLGGRAVTLVTLCEREQGFVVARGNPKRILAWADLVRRDVTFVNRQRGAGTRVLLDTRLAEHGLDGTTIAGYAREEYTHMAAAVAVSSGVADCALAVRAAASALGLDFVPLEEERYDLAILTADLATPAVLALLDTIRSDDFRRAALALGGYRAAKTGTIAAEITNPP
jgi:putative molybdopterin biosynthesis protein